MKSTIRTLALITAITLICSPAAMAVDNLLVNPGFLDLDNSGEPGDHWGTFGAAEFNDFFGGNAHASFYADNAGNFGGVYQEGIPGAPGVTYQLILNKVRIEENWDADLIFGLEYYADDDITKLGETMITTDTATRIALSRVDDNVFAMTGVSVAGTAYVRPIIRFDNVNPGYSGQGQANVFVFDTFLSVVPEPGQEYLMNPGFEDTDANGEFGNYWASYGAAGFNDFWAGNPHASLFADTIGNFGGVYQQGIIGKPGKTYTLALNDVRIEDNFAADLQFGLEYYAADDFTKLGETIVPVAAAITGNGLRYAMTGTTVAGTAFVRPVILFDNVTTTGEQQAAFIFDASLTEPAPGINVLTNPGFDDVDTNGEPGDGWGSWGTTGFNDFWGGNPHASLFADWFDSEGGVFQAGIPGLEGITYQFDLLDTRLEENFDADLRFGMEFLAADDTTKIGEAFVLIDTEARTSIGNTDGNVFSMQAAAPAGTVYVRPMIRFDNVNEDYLAEPQASAFVFRTYLGQAPQRDDQRLKNPDFADTDANGSFGDYWGSYGTTGFNEFFGSGNPHASFFADTIGNSGGIYQQAVLAEAGAEYRYELSNVRIEENFDADLFFGLEYFGDDDFSKIGETVVQIDTSVTGDGLSYELTSTAVPGAVYVRPIVFFDNVGSTGGEQRSAFIFEASLKKIILKGDINEDGSVDLDDYAALENCLAGPGKTPTPTAPPTMSECYEVFDFDEDGDVDLRDAAVFMDAFTG